MSNEINPCIIYDIFSDASVTDSLRGACCGVLVTTRTSQDTKFIAAIQPDGTNNSGEIGGLALAIMEAAHIRSTIPKNINIQFNIFSDSKISIFGVREWIYGWINNRKENCLRKSDKTPVKNQGYIKLIYNMIIMKNLHVRFYHQIGHVGHNYDAAQKAFFVSNKVPLESIGLTSAFICTCNDFVDTESRAALNHYMANLDKPSEYPLDLGFDELLSQKIPLIGTDQYYIDLYKNLTS